MIRQFTTMGLWVLAACWAGGVLAESDAPVPVPAPDPERKLSEYAYEFWGMDEGLPQNTVMALVQDETGYLWLATFGGLARYDGIEFRSFTHPDLPELKRGTTDLLSDAQGTLWVGTQSAGVLAMHSDGSVNRIGVDQGLPSNIIWTLLKVGDELWIGTALGLCAWNTVSEDLDCLGPKQGVPQTRISGLVHDGKALWVGTEEVGLIRVEGDQVERWTEADGLSIARIQDLEMDADGRLWIATFGAGLLAFKDGQFTHWGLDEGLATTAIRSLLMDQWGALWIGTYGAGLQRLWQGRLDRLDSGTGLPNGHIQSLMVDREGSFWFGTNGGLNRLREAKFSTLSVREGLTGPFVRSVAEDAEGNLWVGTDSHGLNLLRDGRVLRNWRPDELPGDSIRALWPAAAGGMWVGAYGAGVVHMSPDGQMRHLDQPELDGILVRALLEDQGVLWVATDNSGILRVQDGEVRRYDKSNSALGSDDVRAIARAPDGSLWFGTYGQGITRYVDGALERLPLLEKGIVFSFLFESDGSVWIGSEDGLHFIKASGDVLDLDGKLGLAAAVFSILDDASGRLWLCTNSAIIAADRDRLLAMEPAALRFFDSDHGMRSRQCNGASQPAGWRDSGGRLWFSTANGVSWTDPSRLHTNPLSPPVVIQEVRMDGRDHRPGAGVFEVPPGTRRLEIDYAALSFISPGKLRYRYRLVHHDSDWVDPGARRSAFYNDLSPGDYRFEVMAANADGIWSQRPAVLRLGVQPLLHQTLWFRAGLAATVLLLIGGFIRWRNADLRQQKVRLERKVEERTGSLADAKQRLEVTLDELNTTQDQLVQVEKMAALGGLVSGVAHEINTPIGNGITIASHLRSRCQKESEADPEADPVWKQVVEGLAMIQSNLERAGSVVASFKRVAVSKDKAERRQFKLNQVLNDTRLSFVQQIQTHGHRLEVDCPEDLELDSYPEAIYEALTHLTMNSLEHAFQEPGGRISISARPVGSSIELLYADDGQGIDRESRQRLFEPFFTDKRASHAGLGMHIVYNITTRLLGGSIECLDGPGARFRLLIPRSAPA